jgi:hypothetical protein
MLSPGSSAAPETKFGSELKGAVKRPSPLVPSELSTNQIIPATVMVTVAESVGPVVASETV